MLPINITTKTKITFSSLSSSTTMGKVQSDSWTNETPWGKIAQFSLQERTSGVSKKF